MKTILEYLKHASTWKGLFALLTAFGVTIKPELEGAILATGLALIGLVQVLVDDHDKDKA